MPKVTLSFKLPEESQEFNLANKGADIHNMIKEFDLELRKMIKYPDEDKITEEQIHLIQKLRDMLYFLANEHGIEL